MTAIHLKSALGNEPAGIGRIEPGGPWTVYEDKVGREASLPIALLDVVSPTLSGVDVLKRLHRHNSAVLVLTALPPPPVIRDLQLLREEEQLTDEPVTHFAYTRAKDVLEYVHTMLGENLAQPHLAPDGAGGLRMEWFFRDSNIRVVIPPRENQRRYIYEFTNGVGELKESIPHFCLSYTAFLHRSSLVLAMADTDIAQHPTVYRGIDKKRWYITEEQRVSSAAFMLREGEEGVSVIKRDGCSQQNCLAGRRECYGEFRLESEQVIRLGLELRDDDPTSAEFAENHAEIRGLPPFEDPLHAEGAATQLAEIASLHYDRHEKFR